MRQEVDSRDEVMHGEMGDWWYRRRCRWSRKGDNRWGTSSTRGWTRD